MPQTLVPPPRPQFPIRYTFLSEVLLPLVALHTPEKSPTTHFYQTDLVSQLLLSSNFVSAFLGAYGLNLKLEVRLS